MQDGTGLERARRRVENAVPYSPEWQAAIEELEELDRAREVAANDDARGPSRGEVTRQVLRETPEASAAS
jgi:hypothetical protein